MIPPLESSGVLPPGQHKATWQELVDAFNFTPRRTQLLLGLRDVCQALATAGCTRIWVDGSFVTSKPDPGDYDACWDPAGVDPAKLDPLLVDFSRAGRAATKGKYLGDLFIAGVTEAKSGLAFVDFFSRSRDGAPKGIVLINPQVTP